MPCEWGESEDGFGDDVSAERRHADFTASGEGKWASFSASVECRARSGVGGSEDAMTSYADGVRSTSEASS